MLAISNQIKYIVMLIFFQLGRTNFRMDPKFDFIGKGNPAMVEKVKPNMFGPLSDKYPSIYPRGETVELPGWIVFDKKVVD